MPNTYKKIATVVVGSGGTSAINFTSIPQTFTDLKIVLSSRSLQGNVYGGGRLEFNSSTNNYSWRRLRGDGSAAASDNSTSATSITNWDMNGANATASVFSNIEFYIPNYTSSNYKSVFVDYVGENNATEAHMGMVAGLWSDTSAITSIKLYSGGGNLVQHTTATLYGIGDVVTSNSTYATGGNQIYTDNTYWYHVFTSSGTFTTTRSISCDYLVVAGGGSGGPIGGGGAGGYRTGTLSLTPGAKTVTVGAGGSAITSSVGNSGENSVFDSIISTGGGGGAQGEVGVAKTGGSGGGGGGDITNRTGGAGNTPSTSPSQGNNGGNGNDNGAGTSFSGGGGGGSGAVGGNASAAGTAGNGGAGTISSISGISVTYASGGGGGAYIYLGTGTAGIGGTGAGNGGRNGLNATSATANTGSGGGGNGYTSSGNLQGSSGAGGSGIVIIRYAR